MVHSSNLTAYYVAIRGVKSTSSDEGKAHQTGAKQSQGEDWKAKYEEQVKINHQVCEFFENAFNHFSFKSK